MKRSVKPVVRNFVAKNMHAAGKSSTQVHKDRKYESAPELYDEDLQGCEDCGKLDHEYCLDEEIE